MLVAESEHTRTEEGASRRNLTHARVYVGILVALAVASVACWTFWYGAVVQPRFILGMGVAAVLLLLADAFPLQVGDRTEISALGVALTVSVVTLGPLWTAAASLPCALLTGRESLLRVAYEASRRSLEIFAAGAVFCAVSDPLLTEGPPNLTVTPTAAVVYATLASGLVLLGANFSLDAGLLWAKYGQGLVQTWEENARPYLASDLAGTLTAGASVLALMVYGPVAAVVLVAGAVGSQAMVHRSRDKVKEIGELQTRVSSLEEALATSNTTFGTMIVEELGRKDGYTHRHAAATSVYAADLAREMGLDEARTGRLRTAGLLHNIGLFGLPEEILTATGRLNSIAKSRLVEHPERGGEALAAIPEFGEMASWVRWHHERPDGRGYPDKLRGPWIPLEAKILGVSQAYAALVLDGPSHPGVGPAKARENLCAGSDVEFDGIVVRAFLRILDTESEGYRMADDHRFVFPASGERRRPSAPGREGDVAWSLPEERP